MNTIDNNTAGTPLARPTVHLIKTPNGWRAHTCLKFGASQEVDITTYRSSNGRLYTTASVHTLDNGARVHLMGFGSRTGDFAEVLGQSQPKRVTAAVVETQHGLAIKDIDALTSRINAHYEATKSGV